MRFHYISPSVLPSRAANAVHVVQQCDALARAGADITLYAKRSVPEAAALAPALNEAYGVDASQWRMSTYYSRVSRADTLRIAGVALREIGRGPRPDAVLSRNLYAAFVLGVLQRRPIIFETHQLEYGIRKTLQRAIATRPWVTTVAISRAYLDFFESHHGVSPARSLVLHDAAPAGMRPLPREDRKSTLAEIFGTISDEWNGTCAYFGHLYAGRGIEIIEAMAATRPDTMFLVIGGNESDVARRVANNKLRNLRFVGHIPHALARRAMAAADVLLMPYQASVSIGVAGHDTAAWMSPMKMFEYLASGVPIISSDLPALREILVDGKNALLVDPEDSASWTAALDSLLADSALATRLGATGHADYLSNHTWDRRAQAILDAALPF